MSKPTNPFGLFTPRQSFGTPSRLTNSLGLGAVIGLGAAAVAIIFIYLFVIVLGAQIAGIGSLYGNLPGTNVTKITTNLANGVVTASGFAPLIYLGIVVSLVTVAIVLVIVAFRMMTHRGEEKK